MNTKILTTYLCEQSTWHEPVVNVGLNTGLNAGLNAILGVGLNGGLTHEVVVIGLDTPSSLSLRP